MRALLPPALLVCCACASAKPARPPPHLKASEQNSYGAAERVVLLAEQTVTFSVDPDTGRAVADVVVYERSRALRAGALQHSVTQAFDRTFHTRPTITGRVIFPDGSEQPLDLERASDTPAWDSALLYTDTRVLSVPVPLMPKGGVLEYTTTQRITDLKPFQFQYRLGGRDPISVDRFRVVVPKAWQLEWLTREAGKPVTLEPAVEERTADRVYTWEARDTVAHPHELNGVGLDLELPLIIARLKSWEEDGRTQTAFASPRELSQWLFDKTSAAATPDDAMRATVQRLLDGAGADPVEKARRLYTHAATKVQYCAIEVGYGGWFPHPAKDVQRSGYGDCKDKANYLKGLLSIAGIDSHTTLIFAHGGYPLPFGLPSLAANFNHAILTIDLPAGSMLVDPTSRTVAFGDLPVSDREATVLQIREGGADLSTAPAAQPSDHVESETFALTVSDRGLGRGTFEVEASGALAAALRQRLVVSVPSKRREVLREWLDMRGVNVTAVAEARGLELTPQLSVTGTLEVPRLLLGDRDARLLRLSAFAPQWLPTLDDAPRRTPLVLWNRYRKIGEVKLDLPSGVQVLRVPPPFTRTSKWLDYRLSYDMKGTALVAHRELTLKERIVPPEELDGLREVVGAVHLAENAAVLLGAR